ncbi:MAG: hypothetical protein E7544_03900 [Ruminococcaceae bacterium]|nr:hypothetical protein [Oscillospiraceae bacterium]
MKNVWVHYLEASNGERFIKQTRVFEKFKNAKEATIKAINDYVSSQGDFFKPWKPEQMLEEFFNLKYYKEKIELYSEDGLEEHIKKTPEYLHRFFNGEAGNINVVFKENDGEYKYTAFCANIIDEGSWYEQGGFFGQACSTTEVLDAFSMFHFLETNCFEIDDPDRDYYCVIWKAPEMGLVEPLSYVIITLVKTVIE